MSKTVIIRKAIKLLLKSIHPRVYFQVVPKDAIYPYLVFDLPNSFDDGSMERFTLEVDGWDRSKDSNAVEALMAAGDLVLHRKKIVTDGQGVVFYRENRMSLLDDDASIRRRKYVYQIRTY